MRKNRSKIKPVLCLLLCAALLPGCLPKSGVGAGSNAVKESANKKESVGERQAEEGAATSERLTKQLAERTEKNLEEKRRPEIIETDWSEYFQGLNGAAVLYDAEENRYYVYNPELAETRRSPCSTFKIISSLLALENGVIDPENSIREWSGEDGYASEETIDRLKQVMLVSEEEGLSIYGKTGMGKAEGITVDAWFTGFAETPEGKRYFCVYLGQTDGAEVTSTLAREIAVRILSGHWQME